MTVLTKKMADKKRLKQAKELEERAAAILEKEKEIPTVQDNQKENQKEENTTAPVLENAEFGREETENSI